MVSADARKDRGRFTFSTRIILFVITLLTISTSIIGVTGYVVSRNALNRKGEQILKNAVHQAIDLIKSSYRISRANVLSTETAQEMVKFTLIGPKDQVTNMRMLRHSIDLGENGYFIVYDSNGNVIMHPSMEGENVWNTTNLKDNNHFIVREQIARGMYGGGFMKYSWWLPGTQTVADKISYSEYFPKWDWIVVATAYEMDFNKPADKILFALGSSLIALVLLSSLLIIQYVKRSSRPILMVAAGMEEVINNQYNLLEKTYTVNEVDNLIDGYNHMVKSLKQADSDLEEKSRYITYLAYHDDLTGLHNRYGMESFVSSRIQSGCGEAFLIQADIVGLKVINSTLGFEQGDRLIKSVAAFLKQAESSSRHFARTSSNEFTFWYEPESGSNVLSFINKLRTSMKEYIVGRGFGQLIDMHVSMVQYPKQGKSFNELYEKTIMAMKHAKDNKSLAVSIFHDDIRASLENEVFMRTHLQAALENGDLTPWYQKQVDYTTGTIVGVEALARWHSKELGDVPPSVFIPAINQLNLVNEFTDYMIRHILSDYPRLIEKYNKDITVSINISPAYFMDQNFLENIQRIFKEHPIPPEKLTLEITEDIFISNFESICNTIARLHNLGARISIDDFGTGYSSLNYLTRMNFDEMKIDKSFITRIIEDEKSFQLFEILCNIAKIYGYNMVAEGVETEEQLEKIKETPLKIIQGFLFSRPEPLN